MSISTNEEFEAFVPSYDVIPEEWPQARQFLVEHLKRISNAVNAREIGWFLEEQTLAGKNLFESLAVGSVPNQFRQIFRVVVNFGQLPNATTKSVVHNVTVNANFSLVDLWLAATDPVNLVGFGLCYYSIAAGDIKLSYDVNNVIVTTASDYSAYTTSYVVLEFTQEV
jgi:hypothetical protein